MIGFLASCFDPFPHPGVLQAMEEAVETCGLSGIVAGLHIEPAIERPEKAKVMMGVKERMIMLEAIRWVIGVRPYDLEVDLLDVLAAVKPDIRIMGEDYKGKPFTGDGLGIPVFYAKRYPEWSATKFRSRLKGRP